MEERLNKLEGKISVLFSLVQVIVDFQSESAIKYNNLAMSVKTGFQLSKGSMDEIIDRVEKELEQTAKKLNQLAIDFADLKYLNGNEKSKPISLDEYTEWLWKEKGITRKG